MSIMIKSEISKQFLLEEDAVEGFRTAVANGQVRLALQIMTEIVDGIMEIFDAALGDDDEDSETPIVANTPSPEVTEPEKPASKEKKEPAKKAQEEKAEAATETE
jgi:hypothetical protein